MLSRAQFARGNETYRFSTANTLSDFPLFAGGQYSTWWRCRQL